MLNGSKLTFHSGSQRYKKIRGVETFFGKLGLLAMRFAPNSKRQGREKLASERDGKSHQIHDKKNLRRSKKSLTLQNGEAYFCTQNYNRHIWRINQ
ncbi:MAG: hypothetical protein K1X90_04730 [Candidatus Kapabacteria bacterium]|nr:hypothetical protein [Candidatus Kapabacteria bacterium]